MVLHYAYDEKDFTVENVATQQMLWAGKANTEFFKVHIDCSLPDDEANYPFVFDHDTKFTEGDEVTEATAYLLTLPGFTDV